MVQAPAMVQAPGGGLKQAANTIRLGLTQLQVERHPAHGPLLISLLMLVQTPLLLRVTARYKTEQQPQGA